MLYKHSLSGVSTEQVSTSLSLRPDFAGMTCRMQVEGPTSQQLVAIFGHCLGSACISASTLGLRISCHGAGLHLDWLTRTRWYFVVF